MILIDGRIMFREKTVQMSGYHAKCLLFFSTHLEGLTLGLHQQVTVLQVEANHSAGEELISLCRTGLGTHTFWMTYIPISGLLNLVDWLGKRWGAGVWLSIKATALIVAFSQVIKRLEIGGLWQSPTFPLHPPLPWHFRLKHSIAQKGVHSCGQRGWLH